MRIRLLVYQCQKCPAANTFWLFVPSKAMVQRNKAIEHRVCQLQASLSTDKLQIVKTSLMWNYYFIPSSSKLFKKDAFKTCLSLSLESFTLASFVLLCHVAAYTPKMQMQPNNWNTRNNNHWCQLFQFHCTKYTIFHCKIETHYIKWWQCCVYHWLWL